MSDEPRPHSFWRHRKGGLYIVLFCAVLEATMERMVVYVSVEFSDSPAFVRPLAEWRTVEPDTDGVHRFEEIVP